MIFSISTINNDNILLPNCIPKTDDSIENISVTEQEVLDIISILNPIKAVGEDKLSHRVLLLTKHTICKPLTSLLNKSLSECKFPDQWSQL